MKIIFIVSAIVLLAGCATPSKQVTILQAPSNIVIEPPHTTLPTESSIWTASGKFAVRVINQEGTKKGGSVYFVWQQHKQDYHVVLTGPLGQGRTTLTGNLQQVSMQSAKTGELIAPNAETLFEHAFGFHAPVSYLKYWLEGKPATANATPTYQENGQLQSLQEGDWQANFSQYQLINNQAIAQKIVVTGPNTTMTVLISDWQTQSDTL